MSEQTDPNAAEQGKNPEQQAGAEVASQQTKDAFKAAVSELASQAVDGAVVNDSGDNWKSYDFEGGKEVMVGSDYSIHASGEGDEPDEFFLTVFEDKKTDTGTVTVDTNYTLYQDGKFTRKVGAAGHDKDATYEDFDRVVAEADALHPVSPVVTEDEAQQLLRQLEELKELKPRLT